MATLIIVQAKSRVGASLIANGRGASGTGLRLCFQRRIKGLIDAHALTD